MPDSGVRDAAAHRERPRPRSFRDGGRSRHRIPSSERTDRRVPLAHHDEPPRDRNPVRVREVQDSDLVVFRWLTTTNHHEIGILYLANSFLFFIIGGVLALLMRTELAYPGPTIVDAN